MLQIVKNSFACARTEYVKWLISTRMIIMPVIVIFIQSFALDPLLKNAELMNDRLNVLEPFIAVANSSTLILILPLAFLTMIADFPKIDTSTVFSIVRTGRYSWLTGQIIKLVMMALTFLFVILAGSVIPMLPRGIFGTNWSRTVTDFLKVFPERTGNFGAKLLPANLYNQMSLPAAAVKSYLLVFAYLMILGLILLSFSLIKKKTLGFVICGAVISLGTAFYSIKSILMWAMPMANSIVWLHFTRYFDQPIVSMDFSVIYLTAAIAMLTAFCYVSIGDFNYDNVSEITV